MPSIQTQIVKLESRLKKLCYFPAYFRSEIEGELLGNRAMIDLEKVIMDWDSKPKEYLTLREWVRWQWNYYGFPKTEDTIKAEGKYEDLIRKRDELIKSGVLNNFT